MDNTYNNRKKLIKKAESLAKKYHKGQVDKAGKEYFLHPQYVSEHVLGYKGKIVGYLHDILEDTDCTEEKLRSEFDDDIVAAVLALTRRNGEDYTDFILRVKQNAIATSVKAADIIHNSMIERLNNPSEKDYQRLKKYRRALSLLGYEDYDRTERYPCKCCGNYTLDEPPEGSFEICEVCGWEDDDLQSEFIHLTGGANCNSLYIARKNYIKYGASHKGDGFLYRKPFPFEIK